MKRCLLMAILAALAVPAWAASGVITTHGTDCSTSTNCLVVSLPEDKGGATITLSGTWTATMQFEGTGDGGTTWTAAGSWLISTPGTIVTSATGNGTWQVNTAGFTGLRVRASALASGSATATITSSFASAHSNSGSGGGGNLPSGTGVVRVDSSNGSAAELSGDATTSGSNAVTVVKVNGGAVPASAKLLGSNSSSQPIAAALTSAHVYVGNGSNLPADVALTGDSSITNAGVMTNTGLNGTAFAGTTGDLVGFGTSNTPADSGILASTVLTTVTGANHDVLCLNGSGVPVPCGTGALTYSSATLSTPNLSLTGTTPGASSWVAGTGNIPALTANSAGFAAPTTGGTAWLWKWTGTGPSVASVPTMAAVATGDNVNESAMGTLPYAATKTNSALIETNSSGYIDGSFQTPLTAYTNGVQGATSIIMDGGTTNHIVGFGVTISSPVTFGNINLVVDVTDASDPVYGAALVYADSLSGGTVGHAACHTTTGVQLGSNNTLIQFPCSEGTITIQRGNYILAITGGSASHTGTVYGGGNNGLNFFLSNNVAGCTATSGVFNFTTPCTISLAAIKAATGTPNFTLQ